MLDSGELELFSVPFVRTFSDLGRPGCSLSEDVTGDLVKDGNPFTSSINTSSSSCGSPEGFCRVVNNDLELLLELACPAVLVNFNSLSHRANSFLSFSLRCLSAYLMLALMLSGTEQSTAALAERILL